MEKYTELEGSDEKPDVTLFEASARALLADGIVLKSRAAAPVSIRVSKTITRTSCCDQHQDYYCLPCSPELTEVRASC